MLEIKNVEVHGLDRACIASGNPMTVGEINTTDRAGTTGESVLARCKKLGGAKAGSGHDNFLKGIIVQFDVKYPQYWTPEYQRYKFETIISSQSKMHRLTTAASSSEFASMFNKYVNPEIIQTVQGYCNLYAGADTLEEKDEWFMKAISNLPMGYEMWMTCSSNYLSLKTIYSQRRNHKLKDWHVFCDWVEKLPMFVELVGIARH